MVKLLGELKNQWAMVVIAVSAEMMNREVLAKSLVASCDIQAGTEITEDIVLIRVQVKGFNPTAFQS